MTQDELKKLDKKVRQVQDPFGMGFPSMRKLFEETSAQKKVTRDDLIKYYIAWKMKSV